MEQFIVNVITEEIKYTEKQIKIANSKIQRRWIITVKNNDKYEIYGTFNDVLNVCNTITQDIISVVSKRHTPTILKHEGE